MGMNQAKSERICRILYHETHEKHESEKDVLPQTDPVLSRNQTHTTHPDFTEGNEGNEGPGKKLRRFVSFVTFCKNSEFRTVGELRRIKCTQENSMFKYSSATRREYRISGN
jgi:hypothetical protein